MSVRSNARRWAVLLVPLVALLVLFAIGRRATSAAPPDPGPIVVPAALSASTSDAGADALPTTGETSAAAEASSKSAVEALADGGFVVDLNLAAEPDLRKLPGIGPSRARAILELRARLGRFKSVDDLARIKGLGKNTLKRLRPLVRV